MAKDILQKSYTIIYSLNDAGNTGLLLPQAFIADTKSDGTPAYIKALATLDTLPSYGIHFQNTVHEHLLQLKEQLSVTTLEAYFNKNSKKKVTLVQFFEDSAAQKTIRQYIDNKLAQFMETIKAQNAVLCLNVERKIPVEERLLRFEDASLKPGLFFSKTVTGINYTLDLRDDKVIIPSQNKIRIITDKPGWIIVNDRIYALQNINANKITPFISKEKLFIPARTMVDFFNRFLKDILLYADVETEGFDVDIYESMDEAILGFTYDFFKSVWVAELSFRYKDYIFLPGDMSSRKTKIQFSDSGDVNVFQIRRNADAEKRIEELLLNLGMVKNVTGRYQIAEGGMYDIFHLPGLKSLENEVTVNKVEIDKLPVVIAEISEKTSVRKKHDWFELYGMLCINGENYPIRSFYKNILEDNPFFRLRDGSYAVLPQWIMSKYKDLAVFGKDEMLEWRIPKTHYALTEHLDTTHSENTQIIKSESEEKFLPSERLKATLRPYQFDGAAWLYKHYKEGLGACLADDMGLGKTLQTLALLSKVKDEIKAENQSSASNPGLQLDLFQTQYQSALSPLQTLVVLPASLIFNWELEIQKFVPSFHIYRHVGPKRHQKAELLRNYDVILTSYQTLTSDEALFRSITLRFLILDESQYIRNRNSQVFKVVNSLQAHHRISLSGTPVENSLADLWSQMEFINKSLLKSYTFFREHFQIPIEQYKDQESLQKLKKLVSPYILRRTKYQVAKDLPALTEQYEYCDMNEAHRAAYEAEKSAARNHLMGLDKKESGYKLHVFSLLMRLRKLACHPQEILPDFKASSSKFETVFYRLDEVLSSGSKVLIFSTFKSYLQLVAEHLEQAGYEFRTLTGDVEVSTRGQLVQDFQNNPDVRVFLISLKAGGTGLNLTAADYVFILDPWWNPFAESQAIARAHRIGRENPVFVIRFITRDTIEDKIIALQKDKTLISNTIIDESEMPFDIFERLNELMG